MLDGFLLSSSVETQQLGLDASSMISLIWMALLNSLNFCKTRECVTCPKQGFEIEAVAPHREGLLAYFCPKQGQDLKPSGHPCAQTWVMYSPG